MLLPIVLHRLLRDGVAIGLLLCLLAPLAWTQEGDERVQVTFFDESHYTDAGSGPAEQRQNLELLANTLRVLGRHTLAPGQHLRIDITDVDLAGRVPLAIGRPDPPRVLTGGADWPRIELRYTLVGSDGQVLQTGQATLDDKAYLQHPLAAIGSERLRYERRMLAQWFERQFGAPHQAKDAR